MAYQRVGEGWRQPGKCIDCLPTVDLVVVGTGIVVNSAEEVVLSLCLLLCRLNVSMITQKLGLLNRFSQNSVDRWITLRRS